ncbi:DUF6082 family protein [Paractinoplanes durhamensis]|nr:DUF6082 family protein [Actinoplanes durhamensis]
MRVTHVNVHRGWITVALSAALIIGFISMVVASPWLLSAVVSRSADWHALSEVGQAYGGISAILSGLAFGAIAASLLLQWRQIRLTQTVMARERHFELTKLAVDDPRLIFPALPGRSDEEKRRWMYLNLWVAHWAMLWETGAMTAPGARGNFRILFEDDMALEWWAERGSAWSSNPSRRLSTFLTIADEAYRQTVADRSATAEPPA